MEDGQIQAARAQPTLELHDAADISGNDKVGPRPEQSLHLPVADLTGKLRLLNIIDSSGTTAGIRIGNGDQLEARYLFQQSTRRLPDSLGMGKMAGILVGRPQRLIQRLWRLDTKPVEKNRDILNPRAEAGGLSLATRSPEPVSYTHLTLPTILLV